MGRKGSTWRPTKEQTYRWSRQISNRFLTARAQAKWRGIPFSLTKEDYISIIEKSECYYKCGNSMPEVGSGLDRKDSSGGYHKENVLPCCRICNTAKGNIFSVEEWKIMIESLVRYRKETNEKV